jgi:GT2 family glycosyltransferase
MSVPPEDAAGADLATGAKTVPGAEPRAAAGAIPVAVVVVTHDSAGELAGLIASVRLQARPGDELVIVDNASHDGTAERARALLGGSATVLESGINIGFPAACRRGVDASVAPLVLLLNPDARLEPGALDRLREAAVRRPDWAAWQPVVMLPDGRVNTAGGVVHYVGIGWAGRLGQDASELPDHPYEAAFASGAAMMIRRSAWGALGGFDDSYFLYCEDLDLGLRLWLSGLGVGVVPDARAVHSYEFDKGGRKWFLLERNRWRMLLTDYPGVVLVAVAPALLAAELGLLAVAARDGWLRWKLLAQLATFAGLPATLRRRRAVQRTRRVPAREFARRLSSSLDNPHIVLPRPLGLLQAMYWQCVERLMP